MGIPTPHINAKLEDFAKTVLMPGDPKRAEYIANKFLTDVKISSGVRGIYVYTGNYDGKQVSVMASGMGHASIGIYSYELFAFYNVENIIRVGSCGVIDKDVKLGEVFVAKTSKFKTNYAKLLEKNITSLDASKELVDDICKAADKLNLKYNIGNIYSSDSFYTEEDQFDYMKKENCVGVEMESAALYYNAQVLGKKALTICSVSDNIITGEKLTAEERQFKFDNMIKLALEVA